MLRQLLLIPCLVPLLAVLLVGALNPRPAINLRLLTWTSPALPVGVWMLLAAGGGGVLSALGTGLALRAGASHDLQRQVRRPSSASRAGSTASGSTAADTTTPGPSRPVGEPSPTVEVPYRVIRRGHSNGGRVTREPATAAVPGRGNADGNGFGDGDGDGWDQPLRDDW